MMALLQFGWYAPGFGGIASVDSVAFRFTVEVAMLAGFVTACPVNRRLIRIG